MAKKKSTTTNTTPRILKMCDLYERQIAKEDFAADKYYFEQLDQLLDQLFEVATNKGWSWSHLAGEAGLAYQTIVNLGERWTKRPQFRTVLLLARAVDHEIAIRKRKGEKPVLRLVSAAG